MRDVLKDWIGQNVVIGTGAGVHYAGRLVVVADDHLVLDPDPLPRILVALQSVVAIQRKL